MNRLRCSIRYSSARAVRLVNRRFLALCCLLLPALLTSGCLGPNTQPNLDRIFSSARKATGKRPIIVIPGVLGSQLVDPKTDRTLWPAFSGISDDAIALPISINLGENRDLLEPRKILTQIKLLRGIPEIDVYRDTLGLLDNYGGYKEGDWDNPAPDGDIDTYYVFPYDWRHDNVESAQRLIHRIEELKAKLKRPDLRFNILAHSMGGLVARYAARYGAADLPMTGDLPPATFAGAKHINRIFMFGTPNEGSMEAFRTLLEGYSITEGLRRPLRLFSQLSRRSVFTAPAIFQLMPHATTAVVLDENLKLTPIDIYDVETWKKYGWGAVGDLEFRQRIEGGYYKTSSGIFKETNLENLDAYFAIALKRAQRFHEALDVPANNTTVPLYAFGGDCEETLAAIVVRRDEKKNQWVTLTRPNGYKTADGRKVTRKELIAAMYEPGDGRVTRSSLLGESLAGRRRSVLIDSVLPINYSVFACDLHGNLPNNKNLQDNALTALVNEIIR